MALITDLPEDLPSGNDLDNVDDPEQDQERGERAEIYLSGAHVATLDNAPNGGGRIVLMVELEVTEEATRFNENGEVEVPIRRCRRVGDMYRPGTARPPTKDEIKVLADVAKAKAAAEKAAQEEAERAEKEHNEPPMFDEEGDTIVHDDAKPADAEDQGDNPEPAAADSTVVQFSDAKTKGK